MNNLEKSECSKDLQLIDTVRACIFKGSTDSEMALYLYKCQEVGVNPLSKMIIPVVFKDREGNRSVSFISTIDFFRTHSEESGDFAGIDEPEYEGESSIEYEGEQITYPDKATIRVYRIGFDRPFIGVARWKEFYPGDKKGHQWRRMPYLMLAKCAEAQARRLAWPKKLNLLYTMEEMERGFNALVEGNIRKKPDINPSQIQVSDSHPAVDVSDSLKNLSKPSEEERESNGLISEKQAYSLYGECKKAGVSIYSVATAAKVQNIFWLTWHKNCKTNFYVMLNLVKTRPESFSKFDSQIKPIQTSIDGHASHGMDEPPCIMDAEEFASLLVSLAAKAGIPLEKGLKTIAGVDHPDDVLPEAQSKVIDWFESLGETPGS